MKIIISIVIILLLILTGILLWLNFFNKKNSNNLVLTYKIQAGIPFKWEVKIDDERISDTDITNDNDLTAVITKKCTVQTFLNKKIGKKEIAETVEDMKKEDVEFGIIISTYNTGFFTRKRAIKKNIIILGEEFFEEM